jgi:hypothetical protein
VSGRECPNCGEPMPARRRVCECGYASGKPAPAAQGGEAGAAAFQANGRAAVVDALAALLRAAPMPLVIGPRPPEQAAAWLADYLFEPPAPHESSRQSRSGWSTPYRDRVLYLARRLIALPPTHQEIVAAYREDGVHWRGDSMPMLAAIAQAHADRDPDQTRGSSQARSRAAIKRREKALGIARQEA